MSEERNNNMAQILTKIEGLLKDKYQPALANQIGIEPSPFMEMIKKTPMTNNKIKYAAPYGINGGFGFGSEGLGTPKAGEQRYIDFEVESVDMYVDIQISNKTVALASNNVGAMINALDAEIKGSYASAKWNVGRALFGNGSGILANTEAGEGSEVKVDRTALLIEGLTVDIYASGAAVGSTPVIAGKRILAVDRVNNTVTLEGASVSVPAGFITVQNSYGRELTGLGAIYDEKVATLYGVSKAENPFINPIVVSADGALTDLVLYRALKQAKDYRGVNVNLIMMGDDAFAAYQNYMKANGGVVIADKHKFIGGATGYSVVIGATEAIIVNERFVPANEAWAVDTSTFMLEQTPWEFMSQDSGIFTPLANTSIYRALLASYGNLICTNPGGCVKITACA